MCIALINKLLVVYLLSNANHVTYWAHIFSAALYHLKNIEYYSQFINDEIENVNETAQLLKLKQLLNGTNYQSLCSELQFVSDTCQRLMGCLDAVQTQSYMAVHIFNNATDLLATWQAIENPPTDSCKAAMEAATQKLGGYVSGSHHPSIDLLKSIRIFDPRQIALLSKSIDDYLTSLPNLCKAKMEWPIYINLTSSFDTTGDIKHFWFFVRERIPILFELATTYIALSADVERFFSKYGSILSPLRTSLFEENLKAYCSVHFNNK